MRDGRLMSPTPDVERAQASGHGLELSTGEPGSPRVRTVDSMVGNDRGKERAVRATGFALRVCAAVVAGQALLGFAGLLDRRVQVAACAAAVLALAWRGREKLAEACKSLVRRGPLLAGWTPLELALLGALLAIPAARLWSAGDGGIFTYDSLVCHLHFPAEWLARQKVEIVPTVFGDVAAAYAPSNAELVFELLMAPFSSDYLAQRGQLPFLLLACLAIHVAVVELGAPTTRVPGLAAALAFVLVPEVFGQTLAAMADIALVAFFLASVPFVVRLWRAPRREDATSLALALGLFAGTKAIALPYSLPLLAACAAILVRHRAALRATPWLRRGAVLLALFVAAGGFWYVRNFLATGNPIYPVTARVAGVEVFRGVYDTAAMRAWTYHLSTERLDFLWRLIGRGGWVLAGAAVVALALRRAWVLTAWILCLVALFWWVVPYQQSRFLFPVFGLFAIAIGAAAARLSPPWSLAGLAAVLIGALLEREHDLNPWMAAGAALGAATSWAARLAPVRLVAAAATLGFLSLVAARGPAYERDPDYYRQDAPLSEAWRWMREHVRGARVAYTGHNLPHPLHGRGLANEVRYVNVAGAAEATLRDFDVGLSGEKQSAEPAIYRRGADEGTWLANLRSLGIDVLFVSAMHPIVMREIECDAEGFPVERAWADAHPEALALRWSNARVRIYGVLR